MTRLILQDRTFEDDDGTWTTVEFQYCHPWENGAAADVYVVVKAFEQKEDKSFNWRNPDRQQSFHLGSMEIAMLHAFLGAAKELIPSQWAEYLAEHANSRETTP